jgi:hypothetical protein
MSGSRKRGLGRLGGFSTATASASKKSIRVDEQDRPDVAARAACADDRAKLAPERLVFIDETGTSTNMARPRDNDLRRRLALDRTHRALRH